MIKPFRVRVVQISFSKSPMLDYACGDDVVNTRCLQVKKLLKIKTTLIFGVKSTFFIMFSLLVNACWSHLPRTHNPTLGAWRNLSGLLTPNGLIIRPLLAARGQDNHVVSLHAVDGNTIFKCRFWVFFCYKKIEFINLRIFSSKTF